ncbi:MAG: type IV pilus secretin PilQ [Elusimicrobia bacterium]|nr:type IV pilus secretin PilQ [Elusimicrobiota bacterium]
MRRSLAAALSLVLACPEFLALPAAAAEAGAVVEGLSVGEDVVTIKLKGTAQHNGFLTANPPRLVVELLDADNQVGAKEIAGKGRFIKRVRAAQFQRSPKMIVRVVMDLKEMAGYRLAQSGNNLVVSLVAEPGAAAVPPAAAPPAKAPAAVLVQASTATAVVAQPAAKPKVKTKPKASPKPEAVVAAVPVEAAAPAVMPVEAPEPAAVAAKPKVQAKAPVAATKVGEDASPELAAMAGVAPAVQASAAPTAAAESDDASARASGVARRVTRSDIMSRMPRDLVTLDFDNTDVRDVFKLLAAKAKVNIIFGNDVAAIPPITLHLSDVPFNEAMQTILSMAGLVTTQVGDSILRVLTPAQLAKERTTATTITKIIPLNYTKASDIIPAIAAVRSAEGRTGSATADPKTNSLILTASPDGMATEERLIAQLDVRPKQVLIEAKLVEVTLTNGLDYGIQWDYFQLDRGRALKKNGVTSIGSPIGLTAVTPGNLMGSGESTVAGDGTGVGASGRGTGVNLPAQNVLGALTLGRVTNNYLLNMTLTAAATQGKVKVLSDPKIATLNNQPANINVTTQYPYVTSSIASTSGGAVTSAVTYVPVGIQLTVTPTINADGRITLVVNPMVSQPSATAPAAAGGAPGIDARSAQTTVLIRDGDTIVIGGLISDQVQETVGKIPILGDIPLLGALFRNKHKLRTRTELLIFVTPKIMAD